MGILDFDMNKITQNPAFSLGLNILGNNQGYGGNTGMALGAGLQDFQRQQSLMAQQNRANALARQRDAQMAMQQKQYEQQQEQLKQSQAQQLANKQWMSTNMPKVAGAPQMVQQAAIKQQYAAPKAPSAFDQKLNLYKKDPKAYKGMFPGQKTEVNVNSKLRGLDEQIELDDRLAAAKNARGYVNNTIETGINSNQMLDNTNTMMDLINKGASTGFGEDYIIKTKQILSQFGVKYPELANQEQLQTLMGDLVMARVQETKGAVSEREMDLFKEYSSNINKTKYGNMAILDFTKQRLTRNVEMSRMAAEMQAKGVRASQIRGELLKYRNANPIKRYTQSSQPGKYNFSDQEESDYQAWKAKRLSQ